MLIGATIKQLNQSGEALKPAACVQLLCFLIFVRRQLQLVLLLVRLLDELLVMGRW